MEIFKKQSLSENFKIYFDKRMIKILLLGAISGFPWVIIGSSLSLWLKEDGLSRSTIGWAGLIFAVYAFNYLWAPTFEIELAAPEIDVIKSSPLIERSIAIIKKININVKINIITDLINSSEIL